MSKSFYVSTAIDYPNGSPHLGHVYEKVVADTYARWYRFLGQDVFFLTGTDENGQKLVRAAEEAGQSTAEYVATNAEKFKTLCRDLHITNDDFIRTTEDRHSKVVQDLWKKLEAGGDVYFDRYSGMYCLGCEAFYTESQAEDNKCPEHGTPLEFTEEDGYFFKLSKYQNWLIGHIKENPDFIFPKSARKEILSRLEKEELRDLSISRPDQGWGIKAPSNDAHVIYTWFDALINYYSAVRDHPEHARYWPASMHVVGKDITWFHTVIWPAMLNAAEIPLPAQVHVHGMLLAANGKKMSKSLGNVVDPYELIEHYSNDLLRYYLLRGVSSGQDGSFSVKDMIARNNNELANDYGNVVLRVIKLAKKRIGESVAAPETEPDLSFEETLKNMKKAMDAREHHKAIDYLWEGINSINTYLNKYEPWRIKDDPDRVHHLLYNSLYGVAAMSALALPFIPESAEKALKMLGIDKGEPVMAHYDKRTYNFGETESMFPKLELPEAE